MVDPPTGYTTKKHYRLKDNEQWISHFSKRRRIKNLRSVCKPVLDSKDPEVCASVELLRETTANEPDPEFGFLHLLFSAKTAADDSGATIVQSITYMMSRWEEHSRSTAELVQEVVEGETPLP